MKFLKPYKLFESVHDTKQEIEDVVSTCKDILLDASDIFSGNSLVDKVYKDNEVVITCFYTVPLNPLNIKSKLEECESTMSDIHVRLIEYMTTQGFTYNNRGDKYTAYFDMILGNITYNIAFSKELDKEFISHLRYLKKYNLLNETFYISNRGDKSSKELSEELEWIEDSTLDLVDSGCTIKLRTYYVGLTNVWPETGLKDCLGLTITIETYKLGLMLPIEVSDNLLTIDSYLRERGFVGYNWNEYDNPNSPTRFQTRVDASLDDVDNNFEKELSQFIKMLSRFTVKAPFDTIRVSYFKPE